MRGFIKGKNAILDGKQTNKQTKNSHVKKALEAVSAGFGIREGERRIKIPEMARRSVESLIEVEIPFIEIDLHVFVSTYYLPG